MEAYPTTYENRSLALKPGTKRFCRYRDYNYENGRTLSKDIHVTGNLPNLRKQYHNFLVIILLWFFFVMNNQQIDWFD